MKLRVGILGIQHESNTFLKELTTFDDFCSDIYAEGEQIIELMREAHHEIGGFIAELENHRRPCNESQGFGIGASNQRIR